jgi:hypothetical protein
MLNEIYTKTSKLQLKEQVKRKLPYCLLFSIQNRKQLELRFPNVDALKKKFMFFSLKI